MSNSENASPVPGDYDGSDERRDNSTEHDHDAVSRDGLPSLRIELVVIDGDEGKKLHALQAQAVFEALLWLAEHRPNGEVSEESA
jgi:hypothetical protein